MMKVLRRTHLICFALLAVLTVLVSCSLGRIRVKNYYIISYTPASTPPAASQRPYPYSLQIGGFEVQRIFNRQTILYRYSPHQIQYYELENWAVRPDYMLTDMVFKHFEASTLTNRVGYDFFETRPDFRIEGKVEALEKLDAGDIFFAHLAMSFKVLRVADGQQIWDYSFDQRKQVYQSEMVYTVRGLSSILQAQMDIIINQLDQLFLSISTGGKLPAKAPKVTGPAGRGSEKPDQPVEVKDDGIDESDFEIIPEKRETTKE